MGLSVVEPTLSDDEELMSDDEMDGDINEEAMDSDSESEDEDTKLTEPSKTAVNNRDGLTDKLQEISWPENAAWIHKLSVDMVEHEEVDVNDDLTRELSFYTQALEGVRKAFVEFEKIGLPFLRPADYYAEMVKSDSHMLKVKGRLLTEKKNIEEAEERKKAREAKRLSKEVQSQKLKERASQKKSDIESVKKWRKQRQQSGYADDDKSGGDAEFAFEDGKAFERSNKKRPGVAPWDRSGGKGKQQMSKKGGFGGKKGEKNKTKRDSRDSKFGFGGKKGLKRQNTAESTNEFRGAKKSDGAGNKRQKR